MSRKRRNKKSEEPQMDESWLLPYADMLTLLLALFIVLFAMSEVDVKKFEKLAYIFETEFASGGGIMDENSSIVPDDVPMDEDEDEDEESPQETENEAEKEDTDLMAVQEYEKLKAMQADIDDYITTNSLTDTLGTKLTAEGLLVSVRTDITFDSGSAKVKKNGKKIAKEIATFLTTEPPHEIVVNGHADDRPVHNAEFSSNWELSTMRAVQFMYLLLDEADIDDKHFSARGYGEFQPVVPNKDKKSRAKNRRVEVLIQPNYDIEDEVEE